MWMTYLVYLVNDDSIQSTCMFLLVRTILLSLTRLFFHTVYYLLCNNRPIIASLNETVF